MSRLYSQPNFSMDVRHLGDYRPPVANVSGGGHRAGRIEFRCPACNRRVRTLALHAGKMGRCPRCGAISRIPQISEPITA